VRALFRSLSLVQEFLQTLAAKLEPLAVEERGRMLAMKKEECEARGEAFDGILHLHDVKYVSESVRIQNMPLKSQSMYERGARVF